MSHFTSIKTTNKLTNQAILVQALEAIGYQNVTSHEEPQQLQDYAEVRGGSKESSAQGNVIVPYKNNRNQCYSDFGYLEQDGELILVADEMDSSRLQKEAAQLQEIYNQKTVAAMEENIIATAKTLNKGTPIINRVEKEGRIRLEIAYPADICQNNQIQQQAIRR